MTFRPGCFSHLGAKTAHASHSLARVLHVCPLVPILPVQALLVNAAKDVAQSLGDLISATRAATGKSVQDPSMEHLKDSARVRWR